MIINDDNEITQGRGENVQIRFCRGDLSTKLDQPVCIGYDHESSCLSIADA
jgi:hypothetical protein